MAMFAPAGQELPSGTFRRPDPGYETRIFADFRVSFVLDRADDIKST